MDTENFIARVVAPGNFLAITYKKPGAGMGTHFFPRDQVKEAANYLRWASAKGMDAYYAVASYVTGPPGGKPERGSDERWRTQENAQALKAFWVDIDVKRDGDKKAATGCYPDTRSAVVWLRDTFLKTTGLPPPNLMVNSGWGIHIYWTLEDAMPVAQWQPYANALKAALIATGATLDVGISADAARILRPPQTLNLKVPAAPKPVEVTTSVWSRPDYPNALVLDKLQPYVSVVVAPTPTVVAPAAGLGTAPVLAGASALAQAAQSGVAGRVQREYSFAKIATKCAQVKLSLATHGVGDDRPIWYLGNLSLAGWCTDGATYSHDLGNGDPRYSQADTDKHVALASVERTKNARLGPPTCAHYQSHRPATCVGCPFAGKVKTPLVLGVDDVDMPTRYRRNAGGIQRASVNKDGEVIWIDMLPGDVYAPVLDRDGSVHSIGFTYELAGHTSAVTIDSTKLPHDSTRLCGLLASMGITIDRHAAGYVGDFVMAWINHLRVLGHLRESPPPAFGWQRTSDGKGWSGLGVGGMFYHADGSEEQVPIGDREPASMYRAHGNAAVWSEACNFVIKDRPDLQVIVAASFGAPLMKLTGHSGVVVSVWSRGSSVGKSSAFTVAQTLWGNMSAMITNAATTNHARGKTSAAKIMPIFWDEFKITNATAEDAVQMLFELSQGQDKGRLNADGTLRPTGEWSTIMVTAGNQPLMDHILAVRGQSDAGAVRAFEYAIERPQMPLDAIAQQRIAASRDVAGSAGRIYAKWLGQHSADVEKRVLTMSQKLGAALNAVNAERFFVAGMACMITGAQVATELGLVDFDIRALTRFLMDTFNNLRTNRLKDVPMTNGVIDLESVLAKFFNAYSPQTLVTTCFNKAGRPDPAFKMVWVPEALGKPLVIHISQREQCMRIDKDTLGAWCRLNGMARSDIVRQMVFQWGAIDYRSILGAGTKWRGAAKSHIVEIPLIAGDLPLYLEVQTSATPASKTPAATVRGNQPKV